MTPAIQRTIKEMMVGRLKKEKKGMLMKKSAIQTLFPKV